ncbi:MAG TPA: flagellar protein FlaG [Bryobacteraceae bacterium]|jgi:uncharacterized FlaG/YvyC family protein|nr:flagellar protein FlaG [Bryobacteraceae bacterium]
MEVPPLNSIDSAGSRAYDQSGADGNEELRNAFATVRNLNARNIPDRKFSVVRDPGSHRFVIQVVDPMTGDILDQFPPEDILKLLSQYQESTK